MQARLGRSERDAEHARHFGQRHAEEVMHHDDGAPFGVEVPERLIDEVPVGDRRREVDAGRAVDRRQFDLDRPVPASAHDVDAGVDDEPAKPGVEPVRIAERRQGPPGADESILDTVARELRVPEDQPGRRVQPRDGVAGKRREGVMIAPLRPLDEVSLVHDGPRSRRGRSVAL